MKKSNFIYIHLGYWIILWLKELFFGFSTYNIEVLTFSSMLSILTVKLITLVFPLLIFYTNFLALVPWFIRTRKIFLYFVCLIALFLMLAPLHKYVYASLLPHKFGWYSYAYLDKLNIWLSFQTLLFENYVYIFFSIAISYVSEYIDTQKKQQELEKAQAVTELAYLKSQINPHFLFNTLNDIYALTYQKAAQAPSAVLKLSALLRYMLKESNDEMARLDKEIEYLKNVVELYEIGQKGYAYVDLRIDAHQKDRYIAPLILINFVENAFKHGVVNDPDNPVKISLSAQQDLLEFEVWNLKNSDQKDPTSGIGLANVKRRLDLIYPEQHELKIQENKDMYRINLKLAWK